MNAGPHARVAMLFAAYAGGALLLYGRVLTAYFLADDFVMIGRVVEDGLGASWDFFVRPLVTLVYLFDLSLWGFEPLGYHLTNVGLHALVATLVAMLSRVLLAGVTIPDPDARLISAISGATFLALPSHSESVAWISGRTDLVASVFLLASLIAYCEYRRLAARRHLVVSLMAYAAALLAKESAVVFPLVVFFAACIVTPRGSLAATVSGAVRDAAVFAAIIAPYAGMRYLWLGTVISGYGTAAHFALDPSGFGARALVSAVRTFSPPLGEAGVALLYMSPRRWLAVTAVGGALALVVCLRARASIANRRLLLRVAFLAVSYWIWVPMLGHLEVSLTDARGERLLYTASVFASMGVAYTAYLLGKSRVVSALVGGAMVVTCGIALLHANETWRAAGMLSQRLVKQMVAAEFSRELILVNLPSHYNGAYVLPLGAPYAVLTFNHSRSGSTVALLCMHGVRSLDDAVSVAASPAGERRYTLRIDGHYTDLTCRRPTSEATAQLLGPREAEVHLPSSGATVLYYSAGHMHPLDRASIE